MINISDLNDILNSLNKLKSNKRYESRLFNFTFKKSRSHKVIFDEMRFMKNEDAYLADISDNNSNNEIK